MSSTGKASKMSKAEKDAQLTQDRIQTMLAEMLRHDDNKYCADCDSKAPRWAAWDIGVFLCIRCAGIHRKMGVHISRVKSVNLDTWTPPQVASVQQMGNSKGRAVYEGTLPDTFKRPQSDYALEQFIRDKYEKKLYMAREFVPGSPKKVPDGWDEVMAVDNHKKNMRRILVPFGEASGDKSPRRDVATTQTKESPVCRTVTVTTASPVQQVSVDKSSSQQPVKPSEDLLCLDWPDDPLASQRGTSQASVSSTNLPKTCQQSTKDSILALYDSVELPAFSLAGQSTSPSMNISPNNPFASDISSQLSAMTFGSQTANITTPSEQSTAAADLAGLWL